MGSIVKRWRRTFLEEVLCGEEIVALNFLSSSMFLAGSNWFILRKADPSSFLWKSIHLVDNGFMKTFRNGPSGGHRLPFFTFNDELVLRIGCIRLRKEGVVHLR